MLYVFLLADFKKGRSLPIRLIFCVYYVITATFVKPTLSNTPTLRPSLMVIRLGIGLLYGGRVGLFPAVGLIKAG